MFRFKTFTKQTNSPLKIYHFEYPNKKTHCWWFLLGQVVWNTRTHKIYLFGVPYSFDSFKSTIPLVSLRLFDFDTLHINKVYIFNIPIPSVRYVSCMSPLIKYKTSFSQVDYWVQHYCLAYYQNNSLYTNPTLKL